MFSECFCAKLFNYLLGDSTGHWRSTLCSVSIGWECGRPPGGSSSSSQASDTVRAAASWPTTTTRTGKVSQSPSSSSRFLFFFSCCNHGATCCRTTETAAAFSRRLAIPWLALLVLFLFPVWSFHGLMHRSASGSKSGRKLKSSSGDPR